MDNVKLYLFIFQDHERSNDSALNEKCRKHDKNQSLKKKKILHAQGQRRPQDEWATGKSSTTSHDEEVRSWFLNHRSGFTSHWPTPCLTFLSRFWITWDLLPQPRVPGQHTRLSPRVYRQGAAGVPRPAATPRLPEPALPAARPPRPVVEGVLLAEVAEVLLLLLGHCAEQLAPAAAPAFAHSRNVKLATVKTTRFPVGSCRTWAPRLYGGGGCRKAEVLYVLWVRQAFHPPGGDAAPCRKLPQSLGVLSRACWEL